MSYTVSSRTACVPVPEFLKDCVDVEKFLGYCRQCPNYGAVWACPPLSVDPMQIWNAYDLLELHARVLTPGADMDMNQLMEAFRREKIDLSRQVLELEQRTPGSLSMAAGTCLACRVCARREGKPCRHPEQVRFSIEALGGDVGRITEKYLELPICWMQNGQLPPYLTLVAGLLLRKS